METFSDTVTHVKHMFVDLNAAHVPLTVLDKVGPLLRLLTVEEKKAFLAQTAVAALLDRSRLVSHETVEAIYQGVVDHLGDIAWSPTWRLSEPQRAPATGPASAEGGPCRNAAVRCADRPAVGSAWGPAAAGSLPALRRLGRCGGSSAGTVDPGGRGCASRRHGTRGGPAQCSGAAAPPGLLLHW